MSTFYGSGANTGGFTGGFTTGFIFRTVAPPCPVCSDPTKVSLDRELLERVRRLTHPDTHVASGPRTLELANQVTAELNAALGG